MSSYRRARRGHPCPTCGGEVSRCQIFDDGLVNCRNVSGPDSSLLSDRWKWCGYVKGGPGGSTVVAVEEKPQPAPKRSTSPKARTKSPKAEPGPAPEAAEAKELEELREYQRQRDQNFKALLAAAEPLSAADRENLARRHLTTEQINELEGLGFRRVHPGVQAPIGTVGTDANGTWTSPTGFLIPSMRRTPDGVEYLGFQVATDLGVPGKYVWASDPKGDSRQLQVVNDNGSVDDTPMFSYIPQGVDQVETLYLADGALKAFVAGLRLQEAVVGSPGQGFTTSMGQLQQMLLQLVGQNAELKILLAPDTGDEENTNMATQLLVVAQMLTNWGYKPRWVQVKPDESKPGRDIDEVDAEPATPLTTNEFLNTTVRSVRKVAERGAARRWEYGFRRHQEGDEIELPFCHTEPEIYAAGNRTKTLIEKLEAGHTLLADRSGTGAGKSHWWASLTRDDLAALGVDQVLVLSPRHMEQGEEFGVKYVRGRQPYGTKRTADGRILTSQGRDDIDTKRGEKLFAKSNCTQGKALHRFQLRNMSGGMSSLCTYCPHRELCENTAGAYRRDREEALAHPVVVLHPAAMQEQFLLTSSGDEGLGGAMPRTGVVLDDVAVTAMTQTIAVPLDSVRRSLALLTKYATASTATAAQQLLNVVSTGATRNAAQLRQELLDVVQVAFASKTAVSWADDVLREEEAASSSTDADPWMCWLEYLRDWVNGRAVAHMAKDALIFKRYNERLVNGLRNAAWVLVLDATASSRVLGKIFGREPVVIAEENYLTPADLKITQVMGLGTLGYNRDVNTNFKLKVVLKVLSKMGLLPKKKTAVVDTKEGLKLSKDFGVVGLTYLGDSRGSNRAFLAGCTTQLMIGSPNTNVGDAAGLYELLFRESVDITATRNVLTEVVQERAEHRMVLAGVGSEHEDFNRFYSMLRQVELLQALGRMRHQRREGEVINVIVLGDAVMPFPVNLMTIAEITTDDRHTEGRVSDADLRRCTDAHLRSAAFHLHTKQRPFGAEELSEESGLHPRLVREWLDHHGSPNWMKHNPGLRQTKGRRGPRRREYDSRGREIPKPLRPASERVPKRAKCA